MLGLAVSLVFLYWALHDTPLPELWQAVRAANMWLLALSITIQTGTFVIRAARWQVFLRPTLRNVSYRARFASTAIGFMANNLLPMRVGELARAYALSRSQPVTLSASFGSLVVERLFDAFTLVILLALPLLPGFLSAPGLETQLIGKVLALLALVVGVASGLLLVIWRPALAIRFFRGTLGRLLPRRLTEKIGEMMGSFIEGLGAMRDPRLVVSGMAWSVLHWCWGALALYVGLLAFGITRPGYPGALFLQAVNAFLVSVPSSPGFFGPFEASVRLALSPFGVAPIEAVSFALAFHIGSFIPITLIGLYYVWRMGLSWREVGHSEEIVEASG